MSLAILWAIHHVNSKNFLPINVGSEEFTFQIKDFAKFVVDMIPGSKLSIATDKAVDSRSYKVDFSLYASLSSNLYYPKYGPKETIEDLKDKIKSLEIPSDFRLSNKWMRLKSLENSINLKILNENLFRSS